MWMMMMIIAFCVLKVIVVATWSLYIWRSGFHIKFYANTLRDRASTVLRDRNASNHFSLRQIFGRVRSIFGFARAVCVAFYLEEPII